MHFANQRRRTPKLLVCGPVAMVTEAQNGTTTIKANFFKLKWPLITFFFIHCNGLASVLMKIENCCYGKKVKNM